MEETNRPALDSLAEFDEYSKYNVQGSIIKSRLLYLHVTHGGSGLKQVLNQLPTQIREQLSTIYIGEWYPLTVLAFLDKVICQTVGGGDEKVYEELGVFSADINLSGAFEPLVHQDIHAFLQSTALLHKSYQDFGEVQYIRLGERGAILQFRYPQVPPASYCRSGIGYLRRAIGLCGGRNGQVKMTACKRKGDAICEYRLEWQQ